MPVGFVGRFCYRHQAGILPGPGMARINRATCSGSSSWTKCRAPGIRNSSEPGRSSWNVRATPIFREGSASPKMIRTGRLNSFSLGIICVRDWTVGNKSSFRRKKAGRALGVAKAPGAIRVGPETGPTTTWLWTELKRLGLPVICIDARHAKAVLKMQINKSDRNDAAGIARIMQTGWFKEVRVKDLDNHAVKALLASRALLVKIKRDLENQIRGLLKNVGLVIGRAKFNVFAMRAEELIEDRPELIAVVGPLLKA